MRVPFGRLSQKTTSSASARYLYSGLQRIEEYDGSGTLVTRYVYGVGLDECLLAVDVGTSAITYLHSDDIGSTILTTDASGMPTQRNVYSPWGDLDSGSVTGIPFGFTGQSYEPEADLYSCKARHYSAKLGRFLQPDPIGYQGGLNLYEYGGSDPINASDPLGLDPSDPPPLVLTGGISNSPPAPNPAVNYSGLFSSANNNVAGTYTNITDIWGNSYGWILVPSTGSSSSSSTSSNQAATAPPAGPTAADLAAVALFNANQAALAAQAAIRAVVNRRNLENVAGSLLQGGCDLAAGFGDTVTLGGTKWVRSLTGANEFVNFNSGACRAGQIAGYGALVALPAARALELLGPTLSGSRLFGVSSRLFASQMKGKGGVVTQAWGLMQRNDWVRVGYSWSKDVQKLGLAVKFAPRVKNTSDFVNRLKHIYLWFQ